MESFHTKSTKKKSVIPQISLKIGTHVKETIPDQNLDYSDYSLPSEIHVSPVNALI